MGNCKLDDSNIGFIKSQNTKDTKENKRVLKGMLDADKKAKSGKSEKARTTRNERKSK